MKKLAELLGQPLCEGDVGVEIECEGAGIKKVDGIFWRTEKDGSLRGQYPSECAEFVMTHPVNIQHLEIALDSLIEDQKNAVFNFSFRTSVHVHVNVQQLTEPEMLAFLYLCLLLEEPLMNFCGETRKANRFCLRYADAEGFDKTLDVLFDRGHKAIPRLEGEKIRYAAINVHALQKYGSIEFRGMRGNMDKAVLMPWCQTLVHLRNLAKELGSPINVFNKYIGMANETFITECLGPHADKFVYEEQQRDVERSFSLTIDLPHIFKARKPEAEVVAPAPRKRPIPAMHIDGYVAVEADYMEADAEYQVWLEEDDNVDLSHKERMEVFIDIFKAVKARKQRAMAAERVRLQRDALEMAMDEIRQAAPIPADWGLVGRVDIVE